MPVTINDLPNELLLEVLQHFEYHDLQKYMRVNKAFNAIIKHTAFDKVLFRSATVVGKNERLDKNTLTFHPALRTKLPGSLDLAKVPSLLLTGETLNEQVTSPPIEFLCIKLFVVLARCSVSEQFEIENPRGVTLRQLCEKICRIHAQHRVSLHPMEPIDTYRFKFWDWSYIKLAPDCAPRDLLLTGACKAN